MDTSHEKTSASDEWYTPRYIFEALGARFISDPYPAPVPTPSREYCAINRRGAWGSFVWCNPPYSMINSAMRLFRDNDSGIALVFARTGTAWWQQHVMQAGAHVMFLRARVKFVRGDGKPAGSAGSDSALVAFGRGRDVLEQCSIPGVLVDMNRGVVWP